MEKFYRGKRILVTGGTGSIGSAVVRRLLEYGPEVIRIFSNNEPDDYRMRRELGTHPQLRFLIGDVRDRERLKTAMSGIHIVFHAAALKHVSICEYNPFEAVQTNVLGTQNTITAAVESGVERMLLVSTDKAVSPVSTMGATKLLAERITIAADFFTPGTRLGVCRFGNVLGSRGSLLPLAVSQVEKGGPVTLTDERMTRFFMTIPEAAKLVLKSAMRMVGGEVFILKMNALRIRDLLEVLVEMHAPRFGRKPVDVEIREIGKTWGESFDQELMTTLEAERAYETEDMYIVPPPYKKAYSATPYDGGAISSSDANLLGKSEIRKLLETLETERNS